MVEQHTHEAVGPARDGDHFYLVALEPIPAGAVVLEVHGRVVPSPTTYSVQVGARRHVAPPQGISRSLEPDPYAWRYLNHSCAPNGRFAGRALVALRDIGAHEEITFDYQSTEHELAEAFRCRCGHCDGRLVRGFVHLTPEERQRRAPHLADHLRAAPPPSA